MTKFDDRQHLLDWLLTVRSNFSIGLFLYCVVRRMKKDEVKLQNRVLVAEDGIYCVPFDKPPPSDLTGQQNYEVGFGGSGDFNIRNFSDQFALMLLRNISVESFEAVRSYCSDTGQFDQMKQQSWYQFARLVRHSFAHDYHWNFRKQDFKHLPTTWRRRTLDISMQGQRHMGSHYDWFDACELWEEIKDFASSLR